MDKDKLKKALLEELERRKKDGSYFPHREWKNYEKRGGGPSWQHEIDDLLGDTETKEIWMLAANSTGKSFKVARTIVEILNGDHPFCKLHQDPIEVHCIVKDFHVFKATIQKIIASITDYQISCVRDLCNPKYKIISHNGTIREIFNRENRFTVRFGSAENRAEGNVGVRPHLLMSDEPFPESLYNELAVRPTLKNTKFIMFATVAETNHAWVVVKALEHIEKPHKFIKIVTAAMIDNPFVPEETIELLKIKYGGEDAAQYRIRVLGCIEMVSGVVFEGIEKGLVKYNYVPEVYDHLPSEALESHYIWAESYDFGISAKDPFLGGFFKVYANGEIVQEDEICIYDGNYETWCDAIIAKREELDMPVMTTGYPNISPVIDLKLVDERDLDGNIKQVSKGTGKFIRKPNVCVGDKQYLARRIGIGNSRLKAAFSRRSIYIKPASGATIETSLPICQHLVKNGYFKIKENCKYSYKFARSHVARYNEDSGKVTYNSSYDHWSDIFRYLVEVIGDGNMYVKTYKDNAEFEKKSKLSNIIVDDINRNKI